MYTAFEREELVEVCVNLTSPGESIGDAMILLEVYNNTDPGSVPANVKLASKLVKLIIIFW